MRLRAGIVVTGTEVLSGIISDRNGPWLSERFRELGVEVGHILVVGDRPRDVRSALEFFRGEEVDLIVTSGGLGPTADDLTAHVVAEFAGREMYLDAAVEEQIWQILQRFRSRWVNVSDDAMRLANRKQAMVPEGATVLAPVGTAPGLIVPATPPVLVLPGPPAELQPMWRAALETPFMKAFLGAAVPYEHRIFRLFGVPESAIAVSLEEIAADGVALDQLEITTCLRRGEIEVSVVFDGSGEEAFQGLLDGVKVRHSAELFSEGGETVDQLVVELLNGRTVAVAESCTGGLMSNRLTTPAGSSAYMVGGAVVYSNQAKTDLVGVPREVIEAHGAVSVEVAKALAAGAAKEFKSDFGIGITGVAGPDGGTPEKPVGTVCISVASADGQEITRKTLQTGDRATIRERTTTVALHMLRRLMLVQRTSEL